MLLSKQKCLLTGVSTESQKRYTFTSGKASFLATRSMTRINVGLALSYVKLLLSSWKTYHSFQFEGIVFQQIVEIPIGTNCAPLIADLFSFCYDRDFMSILHKSLTL